jgi:hypothetical protein
MFLWGFILINGKSGTFLVGKQNCGLYWVKNGRKLAQFTGEVHFVEAKS